MKPVVQSRTGSNGRCFAACVASLLEIPESEVPEWVHEDTINQWLPAYGFRYEEITVTGPLPVGWCIIEGTSPRGGLHAIVGRNGMPYWDPHPADDGTGRGLVSVERYAVFTPIAKAVDAEATDITPNSLLAEAQRCVRIYPDQQTARIKAMEQFGKNLPDDTWNLFLMFLQHEYEDKKSNRKQGAK